MSNNFAVQTDIKAKDTASPIVAKTAAALEGRLARACAKANSAARRLGAGMWGVTKKIGLASGAALAAGTAIAGHLALDFVDAGDELGEFATVTGLGVEALQELRYAADRTGTGTEAFNGAISKFNKSMGLLKSGSGGLAKYLGKVAPELKKNLVGARDTDEAFRLMLEAVNRVEDPQQRAALAAKAFGGAGDDVVKMALAGTKGLADLREEARHFGIISEADAAKAGEMDDALNKWKASVSGLKHTIGSKLVPVMIPVVERMAEWVATNREWLGQKVADVAESIGKAFKAVWDWASKVDWAGIWKSVKQWAGAIGDFSSSILKILGPKGAIGLLAFALGAPMLSRIFTLGTAIEAAISSPLLLAGAAVAGVGALVYAGINDSRYQQERDQLLSNREAEKTYINDLVGNQSTIQDAVARFAPAGDKAVSVDPSSLLPGSDGPRLVKTDTNVADRVAELDAKTSALRAVIEKSNYQPRSAAQIIGPTTPGAATTLDLIERLQANAIGRGELKVQVSSEIKGVPDSSTVKTETVVARPGDRPRRTGHTRVGR